MGNRKKAHRRQARPSLNGTYLNNKTNIARNLSFRHLRTFVCLAHTGSFTQAANKLSMSQPALTLNIRQFEDIVGVKLLSRTTRSVGLTESGEEFLPIAENFLSEFDSAILRIRANARQKENKVEVAVLPSVAIRLLPALIREFAKSSGDIHIQMNDDNGRGAQSQVLNCEADFGISSIWQPHPNLEFTPLVRDRVGLICQSSHPLAKKTGTLNWSDLVDYDFVGMAEDTGIHRILPTNDSLPDTVSTPTYSVLTIAALVGLLEGGKAISALPALAAPDYLNPTLVYRELAEPEVYRQLCLITLRGRTLSPAAQAFIAFIQQKAEFLSAMFPNNTVRAEPQPS
jgi:DNA-binding transcriptional LysR family regulator